MHLHVPSCPRENFVLEPRRGVNRVNSLVGAPPQLRELLSELCLHESSSGHALHEVSLQMLTELPGRVDGHALGSAQVVGAPALSDLPGGGLQCVAHWICRWE